MHIIMHHKGTCSMVHGQRASPQVPVAVAVEAPLALYACLSHSSMPHMHHPTWVPYSRRTLAGDIVVALVSDKCATPGKCMSLSDSVPHKVPHQRAHIRDLCSVPGPQCNAPFGRVAHACAGSAAPRGAAGVQLHRVLPCSEFGAHWVKGVMTCGGGRGF